MTGLSRGKRILIMALALGVVVPIWRQSLQNPAVPAWSLPISGLAWRLYVDPPRPDPQGWHEIGLECVNRTSAEQVTPTQVHLDLKISDGWNTRSVAGVVLLATTPVSVSAGHTHRFPLDFLSGASSQHTHSFYGTLEGVPLGELQVVPKGWW